MAVVLAYRALGLGDLLTAVPALRALRRAFPQAELVLATPKALAPLAALTGAVDRVVDTPPLGAAPSGADFAFNLHGRGPRSTQLLRAARPGHLVAFDTGPVRWRPHEHERARWCRLLTAHGYPADPDDFALPPPPPAGFVGATVIHPGAASEARRWPAERFGAIAADEAAAGRTVVITGSPAERELARTVQRHAPEAALLAGETTLPQLAAVVAHAGRVICGDTGVAHLATAFGTPSVVLFGPTPPDEWGPPPAHAQHRVLWAGVRGDPHGARPHPGLLRISVQDVREALRG